MSAIYKCYGTKFGFDWGPAEVTRLYERGGHVVIGIRARRGYLEVRVTPAGHIRSSPYELPKKPRGPSAAILEEGRGE